MPDNPILVAGAEALPVDYVVPTSQTLLLKSAAALFDGSGAAGAFLPTLELITDGGIILAEVPMSSQVAAGASAQASWFPGVAAAVAAATALNLPWGWCHATIPVLASSTVLTQVDFNPANPNNLGYTSGDSSIVFGNNGTGRFSLIIEETGFYLMASGFLANVTAASAAGSAAWMNSQWLSGATPAGSPVQLFAKLPGVNVWSAQPGVMAIYNADGAHQPVPKAGDTKVVQNSGQNAGVNVYQLVVKLSAVTVANNE